MANESGEYGALYSLTCILHEGTITVTTTGTHKAAGKDLDPSFAFAAEINNGDYVGLYISTDNTALLTGFLPVVTTAAAESTAAAGSRNCCLGRRVGSRWSCLAGRSRSRRSIAACLGSVRKTTSPCIRVSRS